jgi:uncharacterized protein YaaQ
MAKTVALTIDINLEGGKDIQIAATDMKSLKDAIKAIEKELSTTDFGSKDFNKLSSALDTLTKASREVRKDAGNAKEVINELNKALSEPPKAVGYYRELQRELTKLTNQYKDLSKAELEGARGVALKEKIKGISNELKQLDGGIGNFQRNVGNYQSAFGGLGATVSRIGGIIGSAYAAITGGSKLVQTTAQFEALFAVLKQNVGTDFAARQVFEQLADFAATTPRSLEEVIGSFNKLSSTGVKPTIAELTKLNDLAASQGKSLDQLSEAVIDAQGFEFTRLQELGIRVKQNGDQLIATFRGQTTELPKTEAAVRSYLVSLGDLSSVQGASESVAKTLGGAISNLGDNFDRLLATLGSSGGILQTVVTYFSDLLGNVNEYISTPLSETLQNQQIGFNSLIGVLQSATASVTQKQVAVQQLNSQYGEYIGNVDLNTASEAQLNQILEKGNALFNIRILNQRRNELIVDNQKKQIDNEIKIAEAENRIAQLQAGASKSITESIASLGEGGAIKGYEILIDDLKSKNKGLVTDFQKNTQILDEVAKKTFGKTLDEFAAEQTKADEASKKADADKAARDARQKAADSERRAANATAAKEREAQAKKDAEFNALAEGSVAKLTEQIKRLKDELTKSTPNNLDNVVQKLVETEKQLEKAQTSIDLKKALLDPEFVKIYEAEVLEQIAVVNRSIEPVLLSLEIDPQLNSNVQGVIDNIKASTEKYDKEQADKKKKEEEKKKEETQKQREEIESLAIESAASINQLIADIEEQRVNKQLETQLSAIDAEYKAKIDAAQGNATLIAQLEKEKQEKILAAEREAAKKRKKIALKEAAIAGALAAIKALPNPIAVAAAIAATLIQIAAINAQEFAQGGKVQKLGAGRIKAKPNIKPTAKGDNVLAYVRTGELILNDEQQRKAKKMFGDNVFASIGVPGEGGYKRAGVRGYAEGGAVAGSTVVSATISVGTIEAMAAAIGQEVAAQTKVAVQDAIIQANLVSDNRRAIDARVNGTT